MIREQLVPADSRRAERRLEQVTETISDLLREQSERVSADLGRGAAGALLFFEELARSGLFDCAQDHERAVELVVDGAERLLPSIRLMGGVSGALWALRTALGPTCPATTAFDGIIADLLTRLEGTTPPLGFVDGLAGLLIYGRASGEQELSNRIEQLFVRRATQQVFYLSPTEASWRTPSRELAARARARFPSGVFELGMAHGAAGIALSLARVRWASTDVVHRATTWIANVADAHDVQSVPTGVDHQYQSDGPARLAWCAGPASIGFALREIGVLLAREGLVDRGTKMCAEALGQSHPRGPSDPFVCHGTAGLLLLALALAEATGQAVFHASAKRWWTATLELEITAKHGVGLLGLSGLGLALLEVLSGTRSRWRDALLLSEHPKASP